MLIVTVVLFLLPCSVLWLAWRRQNASGAASRSWRKYCGMGALLIAGCSTALELVFFFSWFHNGGSPHGLTPSPGI